MLSLLPRNVENVCRLCLTESVDGADTLPLFPVRGGNPLGPNTVVSKILQCTGVKIEHFEGAPATICEFCHTRIEDWQSFREQCMGTDEYLRNSFRPKVASQQQTQQQQPQVQQYVQPLAPPEEFPAAEDNTMTVLVENLDGGDLGDGDDEGSYLIGEELSAEDVMRQDEQYFEVVEQHGQGQQEEEPESLVQMMNRKVGIRVPKWSKEFGAKLNSLLHVVGGDRPHQCKLCRKRFLRRPHCRRHVAQAHAAEIDDVVLPKNWELLIGRRFNFSKAPIEPLIEPVPPPPGIREETYEPTIYRPHQCDICRKCFKRPQHLRRHKTSHLQIEIDRSEIMAGIEAQQKAQEQLSKLTNGGHQAEDDDVIALSDDDDEDEDPNSNEILHEDEDMGEEISPEEFNGLQQFLGDGDGEEEEEADESTKPRLRLSDISRMYYDESDNSQQDSDPNSTLLTKQGTARKRAPPMEKIPGERPYQCQLCSKLFKRSDHLKSHMKVHSSETEYTCPHCQKGFRYRQNYLIHLKNRTCFVRGRKKKSKTVGPVGRKLPKLLPKPAGGGITVKQFDGNGTVRHKHGILLGD